MKYIPNNFTTEIKIIDNFESLNSTHKVVIIDKCIYTLFGKVLEVILKDSPIYIFSAKESKKTFEEVEKIFSFFVDNKVNRETVIFGIGGGITMDIGAFAASIYMRGCKLILIPTTFLGMIDAAIGGKTAINFNGIKNNIGTFYPAEKIIINTGFLKSLPEKEMKNGWAECLKAALIKPSKLMSLLESKSIKDIDAIVREAIAIKESIVRDDLQDKGNRRILNLGHTFGHIIESISEYQISHGEAISVGICAAAYISMKMNFLAELEYQQILNLFDNFDLPVKLEQKLADKIALNGKRLLKHDKKKTEDYNFIFLRSVGDVFVYTISEADIIFNLFIDYLK